MDTKDSNDAAVNDSVDRPLDLLWGTKEISKVIRRTERQTGYLLEAQKLKSAKKIGGRWVVSRSALLAELGC